MTHDGRGTQETYSSEPIEAADLEKSVRSGESFGVKRDLEWPAPSTVWFHAGPPLGTRDEQSSDQERDSGEQREESQDNGRAQVIGHG